MDKSLSLFKSKNVLEKITFNTINLTIIMLYATITDN